MGKVINVAFGIGIAVILFIVVLSGIKVFYPNPTYEKFCPDYNKPAFYFDPYSCSDNMTVEECKTWHKEKFGENYEQRSLELQKCYEKFEKENKKYGTRVFIITCIIGAIFFLVGLYLISITSISAGFSFSGVALLIYGFMAGWRGSEDLLKFILSSLVALLFILAAFKINKSNKKN